MGKFFTLGIALTFTVFAHGEDATITIANKNDKKVFKSSELLNRKDIETIVINDDPAYPGKKMKYKAVKAANLFKDLHIADDAVIQFKALDGFSAPVSKERLLNENPKQSVAYLAIESETEKWPPLGAGKPSAGPFYLVWKNPEFSKIGREEWPFMVASFEVKGTLESLYPDILPAPSASPAEKKGFQSFVQNCFACHTMNKSGTSQMGPDLNVPMNPTEYLQIDAFKKLVRNPQNLRHWPQSRMFGFDKKLLPDAELGQIIAYLKHMSGRKK